MFAADTIDNPPGNGASGNGASPGAAGTSPGKLEGAAPKRLGDQLLDLGVITRDQLEIALAEQKQSRGFLGEVLVTLLAALGGAIAALRYRRRRIWL